VLLLWLLGKGKKHRLKLSAPVDSVLLQGRLFRLWFTGHNLSWAFGFSLLAVSLPLFFGPVFEVMAAAAGALACTCFSLLGLLAGTGSRTLGLCWQSSIPREGTGWWDYVGAVVILRERFEQALQQDQKRPEPVLWSISRVLERASGGGADRTVDLTVSPAVSNRAEWFHRFKVFVPIFFVTVVLAFLLRELPGLTPPDLGPGAGGPGGGSTEVSKKADDESERPDESGKSREEGGEKSGGESEEKKNEDGSSKEAGKDSGEEGTPGEQGETGDKQTGSDTGKETEPGETGEPGDRGSGKEQAGKEEGHADKEESKGEGKSKKEGKENKEGKETGKEEGKEEGKQGDQPGGKGGGGGESGDTAGESQSEQTETDADSSAGGGKGRGQSPAGSEQEPRMGSGPAVPLPPPGAVGMLELDLPPLDQVEKAKESTEEKPGKKEPGKASDSPALSSPRRTGKQPPSVRDGRAPKPEQYLPNWILALLEKRKTDEQRK
ncbi:MAG: hypothetical protein GY950_01025, partial [bacterium]|nr:hypothetical protein [bacterium]